ncbi:type II toxin-antitoxin system VapC family toxin [Roseitalea porphyridii]|uniref:Type II toxin-antitoxin system VapC family toxin n=1 Tax=Roseitalea porphyridii TaxID=1852022 RepID=A0A4P6V1U1_9HYPH|nr:type II toxin-antitoxin system VapC family toxin [Roseitalea porphyridii]QBK30833.1 type II toxin-antitoxin system VapC family toxin [Roseitalea porphyridii]
MSHLLDTHALVWWLTGAPLLSKTATTIIADPQTDVFVSAVSAFEIANKVRIGKWHEAAVLADDFEAIIEGERFSPLSINQHHAVMAGLLPGDHRDPFDRLLASQARSESLTLVTSDDAFSTFSVATVW